MHPLGKLSIDRTAKPRVVLIGPMPPTKGGITTFMLNLTSSFLGRDFEFMPYTISRPVKRNVIDNYGYGAIFKGGLRRVLLGVGLTIMRLARFTFLHIMNAVDIVQMQASDYKS